MGEGRRPAGRLREMSQKGVRIVAVQWNKGVEKK